MEKICSFFGHRDVFENITDSLDTAIEKAITEYGINTFYVGDRGAFDRQAASAVRKAKTKFPEIKLILVLPYFSNKLNEYKELYQESYDDYFVPNEIVGIHPKGAITQRNRWMVKHSQLIISYIHRDFGGAYNTIKYAKKLDKVIINIKSKTSHHI